MNSCYGRKKKKIQHHLLVLSLKQNSYLVLVLLEYCHGCACGGGAGARAWRPRGAAGHSRDL